MPIDRPDLQAVGFDDLSELIEGQVAEGQTLEFKREVYGNSDASRRELLKDVSSLANTSGGHLVIGIAEDAGVAVEILGVTEDPDAEKLRMENILRSGLEPPVPNIQIHAIGQDDGTSVFLLRVPRSWNPPHRVVANRSNRFFMRNSAGVFEPSVPELRSLFSQAQTALEQARQFREERVAKVLTDRGRRPLQGSGRLFVHIVPHAAFSGLFSLDVEQVHSLHRQFQPLGNTGWSPRYNYLGFVNERGGENNNGYTQIFRNGIVEATFAHLVRETRGIRSIPGVSIEQYFFGVFPQYLDGLRALNVPTPCYLLLTLEGVYGAKYAVDRDPFNEDEPFSEDYMALPECILESYGDELDYHRAIRPAFDALWNAIGRSKSMHFNEDGLWAIPGAL